VDGKSSPNSPLLLARTRTDEICGKIRSMTSHLVKCERVPVEVANKARGGDDSDDAMSPSLSGTASVASHASTSSAVPNPLKRKASNSTQSTFTVAKTRRYTFSKSEEKEFEDDFVKMVISAGWSFNSTADPEVKRFFARYRRR
jgi:hypothetical protein